MLKYTITILCLLIAIASNAQKLDTIFNGYLSPIVQTGGSTPNFTFKGAFHDDLGTFDGSEVTTSAKLIMESDGRCYELPITALTATGTIISGTVNDASGDLSAIPSGTAAIVNRTTNKSLYPIPAGLPQSTEGCIHTINMLIVDTISTSGSIPDGVDSSFVRNDSVFLAVGSSEYFTGIATSSSSIDTSGYNLSFEIDGDSLRIVDGLSNLAVAKSDIAASGGSFSVLDTTITAATYTVNLTSDQEARVFADVTSNNITATLPDPAGQEGKTIRVTQSVTGSSSNYITVNVNAIGNRILMPNAEILQANIVAPPGFNVTYTFTKGYDDNSASDIWVVTEANTLKSETDGLKYYDKITSAEQKIKVDYEVDAVSDILTLKAPDGARVRVNENDTQYFVESDSITGYATDSLMVVPLSSGNYAIMAPRNNVFNVKDWGAVGDGNTDDTEALNKLFAFIQNRIDVTPFGDIRYQVSFTGGRYYLADTVFLPAVDGAANGSLVIDFAGSKIESDGRTSGVGGFFMGVLGSGSETCDIKYEIKNGYFRNMIKPMTLVGLVRSRIENLSFVNCDTSLHIAFGLNNTISGCEFTNCTYGFIGSNAKQYQGGTGTDSEFNNNLIDQCRCYGLSTSVSCFELLGADMNVIQNTTCEGIGPEYSFKIDHSSNNNRYNTLRNIWIEHVTAPDSAIIYAPQCDGRLIIDVLQYNKSDTTNVIKIGDGNSTFLDLTDVVLNGKRRIDIPVGQGGNVSIDVKYRDVKVENAITTLLPIMSTAFPNGTPFDFQIHGAGHYLAKRMSFGVSLNLDSAYQTNSAISFRSPIVGDETRVGMGGGSFDDLEERFSGYFAGQEGFFGRFGSRFGWSDSEYFDGFNPANISIVPYYIALDTASAGKNIYITPGSNSKQSKFYINGSILNEGYASANDMSTTALGKTLYKYAGWATDGTMVHVATIPATSITSTGDSSTVQLEITGLDSRLDDLESERAHALLYNGTMDSVQTTGTGNYDLLKGWLTFGEKSSHWTLTDTSAIYNGPTIVVNVRLNVSVRADAAANWVFQIGYAPTTGVATFTIPAGAAETTYLLASPAITNVHRDVQFEIQDGYEIKTRAGNVNGGVGITDGGIMISRVN